MTTDIVPFDYNACEIRTLLIDGEPWFIAADVCAVLSIANVSDALSSLDDDEKRQVSPTIANTESRPGAGPQSLSAVNESGLYTLIFKSRKPSAKEFRRWVTHTVLPTLRIKGAYEMPGHEVDPVVSPARPNAGMVVDLGLKREVIRRDGTVEREYEPAIAQEERRLREAQAASRAAAARRKAKRVLLPAGDAAQQEHFTSGHATWDNVAQVIRVSVGQGSAEKRVTAADVRRLVEELRAELKIMRPDIFDWNVAVDEDGTEHPNWKLVWLAEQYAKDRTSGDLPKAVAFEQQTVHYFMY